MSILHCTCLFCSLTDSPCNIQQVQHYDNKLHFFIMLYLNDHKSSEDLFDFCPANKRLFLWTCNWKKIFLCISQTLCDVKKRMPWNVTALKCGIPNQTILRKSKTLFYNTGFFLHKYMMDFDSCTVFKRPCKQH